MNNVMFYEGPTQIQTLGMRTPIITCKSGSGCMKLYVSVSMRHVGVVHQHVSDA